MPIPERRYAKRSPRKQRASLVVNLEQNQKRFPCLVLDSSEEGFRLRGSFRVKRGQVVEIILDVLFGQAGSRIGAKQKQGVPGFNSKGFLGNR